MLWCTFTLQKILAKLTKLLYKMTYSKTLIIKQQSIVQKFTEA
jgi:hypothetical protein